MEFVAEKTDPDFLERLSAAAKQRLTRQEIEQQQISFVYSVMCDRKGMTREKAERLVRAQRGA